MKRWRDRVWRVLAIMVVGGVCAGIVLAPPAQAEGGTWAPISQLGFGYLMHEVAVQGNYAYVPSSGALVVFDISVPSASRVVGHYAPVYATVQDVAIAGHYAYVANGGASNLGDPGMSVVDISDPTNPTEHGRWHSLVDTGTEGLWVEGDYAYVVGNSLHVVDISDPSNPTEVPGGSLALPAVAHHVTVSGIYAYVADSSSGVRVVDISNPANPVERAHWDTLGEAYQVALHAAPPHVYALVAQRTAGVRLVDVTDPLNPSLVTDCATPGWALGVAIAGQYAYVADAGEGLAVIDLSDAVTAHWEASCALPGAAARGQAVVGTLAYVADDIGGFCVVDIADPLHPVKVGQITSEMGYNPRVAAAGRYAYVGEDTGVTNGGGWRIVDLWDVTNPVQRGFTNGYGPNGVAVEGDYEYGADDQGLWIIDISDPDAPMPVGFWPRPWDIYGVAVSGGYVYLADWWRLYAIDVADPASPVEAWHVDTALGARGVAVAGRYVYVANGAAGLRIIDTLKSGGPGEVGFYDTPGSANEVAIDGHYAYVADGTAGLQIIDVSNAASPQPVSAITWSQCTDARSVAIGCGYAYVGAELDGLRVVDVSNPATPTDVAYWQLPGRARSVALSSGRVYVAAAGLGFAAFDEYKVVSAPQVAACAGSTLSVPILINNAAGVAGVQIDLRYDPTLLTATSVELGSVMAGQPGWQVYSQLDSGRAQAMIYSDQAAGLPDGGGSLAVVNFQVNPAALPGQSSALELREHLLSDHLGNEMRSQGVNGGVQIIGVHHFAFDPISSPQGGDQGEPFTDVNGNGTWDMGEPFTDLNGNGIWDAPRPLPFAVTIRALDQNSQPAAYYTGSPTLSDLTGTAQPVSVGPFVNGVWTGDVTIGAARLADVLHVADGAAAGDSNAFDVIAKGSVNGDQEVNVLDVVKTVNIILGSITPEPWQLWAADMNSDEVVNVQDIILIINKIFGMPPAPGAPLKAAAASSSQPGAGPVVVSAQWRTNAARNPVLAINLGNAAGTAGAQLEVTYNPKRARFVAVRAGTLISGASDWNVYGNDLGGRVRALAYSATAQGLSASKGSIVEIEFKATGKGSVAEIGEVTLTDGGGNRIPVSIAAGNPGHK